MTGRDRGSMSVYAAILAPALFACVMFFTNAVVRWDAWREAHDVAAAAARAAAQPTPTDFSSGRLELGSEAEARALGVVWESGHAGEVTLSGNEVIVTVIVDVDYVFPYAPFGDTVTGVAQAGVVVSEEGLTYVSGG